VRHVSSQGCAQFSIADCAAYRRGIELDIHLHHVRGGVRSAVFAFGRVVLSFSRRCFFLPSQKAKTSNDIIKKYHAAVYPEPDEGQAIDHVEVATA
jgi:hypothetical protein